MTDPNIEDSADRVAEGAVDALTAIFGEASPGTVFSQPDRVGEDLIFTAAAWERAGGFGFGAGGGRSADDTGSGGGAGGGGASQGRPVAVIRVGAQGVEVRPVIDFTKIGVTLLLSAIGVWRSLRRAGR